MKVQNQTPLKTSTNSPSAAKTKATHNTATTSTAAKTERPTLTGNARESAKTEISDRAKEMSQAKALAQSAPDIREDRVAKLKEQISQGKYEINAEAIADRMVDEHLGM
jgi:negative regulator of flagellin synthesis FlgM